MISRFINSIGCEIECGYNEPTGAYLQDKKWNDDLFNNLEMASDGSINVRGCSHPQAELRYWNNNLTDFLKVIKMIYAKGIKVNTSCGLHIHIKLKNKDKYLGFWSYKEKYDKFIKEYKDKFATSRRYMNRLHNHYCTAQYNARRIADQLKGDDCERYNAINLSAYKEHKTIEFRIFPAQKDFEEFEDTILWFVKTIDTMLSESTPTAVVKFCPFRTRSKSRDVEAGI
jgi:hypothetical protein